jgi:hypothetical protein
VATAGGTTLTDIGAGTWFTASSTTDLYAEFSWFTDAAAADEQHFFAATPHSNAFNDPALLWYATVPVGAIPAFGSATLAAFDAQLALDPTLADASIAGVGVYNDLGATIDLFAFQAGGNLFYFTPDPVFSAPNRGVTATTTGFVPGETVSTYQNTTESTSDPIDLIADVNGSVSYTWVANFTNMDPGVYAISFVGLSSGVQQFFEFDVIAQTALAPEFDVIAQGGLAATGFDATVPAIAGGMLLLGGAALALTAAKRRTTA